MRFSTNNYDEKDTMKMIRENTGLTQNEFGSSINLSGMTIQGYERGVRNYTFKTLMKLAKKHDLIITIESKKK